MAHRPPTWHHIRHDRKCERSAGELVFGDEARGRRPRSSRLSRHNSGVAGRGVTAQAVATLAADDW